MPKLTLNPIGNISGSESAAILALNNNFDRIEEAIENTVSRDGSLPNQMEADLDLNGNDLLGVENLRVESLFVNNVDVVDIVGRLGPEGPPGPEGPQGPPGGQGPSGTLSVGTVSTGAAGSSASVVNVGTSTAAVLNITIPRGDTGASGSGTGDMLKSTYDPTNINASPFARANHTGTQAISTVTNLQTNLDAKSPLASPTFIGDPKAPTPSVGDNDTSIATTAYVRSEVPNVLNATGSAPIYAARAWVQFTDNGTTITINGQGNVTSVTRAAAGNYEVTLTNAMPDTNYAVLATAREGGFMAGLNPIGRTTSVFRVSSVTDAGAASNTTIMNIVVFR